MEVDGLLADLRAVDPDLQFATTKAGLSRGGTFSPEILVSLLLYLVADAGRNGYQSLLDSFWDETRAAGIQTASRGPPAAASFCNARRRLRPEIVLRTLHVVNGRRRAGRSARGRSFFAVDASRRSVQRSEELWREAGACRGSGSPQVQLSVLLDLDDEAPLNVEVGPFDASEREQCLAHLGHLRPADVLVLDRGYPGFGLLRELERRGIDFVVRVSTSSTFPAVERFLAGGMLDAQIEIAPSASYKRTSQPDLRPLRVRAVRPSGPRSAPCVILTSLPRGEFSRHKIAQLYRRRWRIEEYFKLAKSPHFGATQPHAKYLDGVKQEIYAQALHVAITRWLLEQTSPARPRVKSGLRVHFKAALHAVGRCLVELLLSHEHPRRAALLERLGRRMHCRAGPIRPGRSFPRRSFRPCPKWCSTGRRGKVER